MYLDISSSLVVHFAARDQTTKINKINSLSVTATKDMDLMYPGILISNLSIMLKIVANRKRYLKIKC